MNVVIYARYSSHNQTEQSIEGQVAVCQEYASRNNYTIVGEYIDRALTGTSDKRPQFQKMIQDSNKKFFEGVLVYQLDRFARNRYDSATYKNKLKKNGVRVFSARENISQDASGVLMESVLEGMAEYYSAELSQKVKRGMKINAEKCLYNGGSVPLGYRINSEKKFEVDEEKAKIVKKIFYMYSNGYTMADIVRYLNENKVVTGRNGEFKKNSLRKMLTNKKYIGIYCHSGIEISNGIPSIIDNDTFNKVAEKLKENKKAPAKAKAKEEYLLTTKLFCGKCMEMMTGTCGTSGTKGIVHYYYTCNGRKKVGCNKKNIRKNYIEDIISKYAKEILTDSNIKKIAKDMMEIVKEKNNSLLINELEKTLKTNKKQKENLMNSLKMCEIDSIRKSIFEEMEKLEEERKEIENRILYEKAQQINITEAKILFFLNQMKELDINKFEHKKLIINTFVDKVYLYDKKAKIIFNVVDKNKCTIEIPDIEQVDSSLLNDYGAPQKDKTNFYYFLGGFVISINI